MIKGQVNIDFVTDDMLHRTAFTDVNQVVWNWRDLGLPEPAELPTNAIVHQSFEQNCPQWAHRIKHMFDDVVTHSTVTVNLIKPGHFIPPHKDMFLRLFQYAEQRQIDITNKEPVRINLFLQDHKIGHFFEMENQVCMNYKKGDFAVIKLNRIHSVVNIGNENRFTLQVSGFTDKDTFT